MQYLLKKLDFGIVEKLFQPLMHHLFCAGVVKGLYKGNIYVDDPIDPKTAFLITQDVWGFLAGNPNNLNFNMMLNKAIRLREVISKEIPVLQLSCSPSTWNHTLDMISKPSALEKEMRCLYIGDKVEYEYQGSIPDWFEVCPIDKELTRRIKGGIPSDVTKILGIRELSDHPIDKGFGFVILLEGEIISYSVVDCVVGKEGEIFLYTNENHREKGLATVVSAATIEFGLANGLTTIKWDCQEENVGSNKIAKKLGFVLDQRYPMYFFFIEDAR